ncbi:MAG TPA: hypothetical protein VH720_16265 [Candidatus Limnocylindrales bacterium]|jgi:hypothetical protein
MTRRPASTIPPERLALYERLVATQEGVERKGASVPYTSVNGHMFSFLTPTGSLALRLGSADRAAFLARHETRLHEAHGTVMKEYVAVPDALFADLDAMAPWFAAGRSYVAGLRPKPTTRRGR